MVWYNKVFVVVLLSLDEKTSERHSTQRKKKENGGNRNNFVLTLTSSIGCVKLQVMTAAPPPRPMEAIVDGLDMLDEK